MECLEISFTCHPGKLCNTKAEVFEIGNMTADNSGYYDNCKKVCADNNCDGFVVGSRECLFVNEHCRKHGFDGAS